MRMLITGAAWIACALSVGAPADASSAVQLADLFSAGIEPSSNLGMVSRGPDSILVAGSDTELALLDLSRGRLREVGCGPDCRLVSGDRALHLDGWIAASAWPVATFSGQFGLWAIDEATAVARPLLPREPVDMAAIPGVGRLLFSTRRAAGGRSLWATNGTAVSLVEFDQLFGATLGDVRILGARGSVAWLQLSFSDGTRQLARTDGSLAGTVIVGALTLPARASAVLPGGDLLFTTLPTGERGELWRAGLAGAFRVADQAELDCPDPLWIYGFGPAADTADWGLVACRADVAGVVTRRYVLTDGTSGGTQPLSPELRWDVAGFTPLAFGGRYLAAAEAPGSGKEVWSIDRSGVARLLVDLCPGECSSEVLPMRPSPGTEQSALPLVDLRGEAATLLFVGPELEVSSPTSLCGGCSHVAVFPSGADSVFVRYHDHRATGDFVVTSNQLAAGSRVEIKRWAPTDQYLPPLLALAGSELVFSATTEMYGNEPWVSDGTLEGTRLWYDWARGPRPFDFGSGANGLVRAAQGILGFATDGERTGLWRFRDGTAQMLAGSESSTWNVAGDGHTALFATGDGLVLSDGETVHSFPEVQARFVEAAAPGRFVAWGIGGLWAVAADAPAAVRLVPDQQQFTKVGLWGGELLFVSSDRNLWSTDGTQAGTRILRTLSSEWAVVVAGQVVWYDYEALQAVALGGSSVPRELWRPPITFNLGFLAAAGDRVLVGGSGSQFSVGLDGSVVDLTNQGVDHIQWLVEAGGRVYGTVQGWFGEYRPGLVSTDGVSGWRFELAGGFLGSDWLPLPDGSLAVATPRGLFAIDHQGVRLLAAFDWISLYGPGPTLTLVDDLYVGLAAARGSAGEEPWIVPFRRESATIPRAPQQLRAEVADGVARLSWSDRSSNEEGFLLESRSWQEESWRLGAVVPPNVTEALVASSEARTWRVVAANAAGRSNPSNVAGSWVLPPGGITAPGQCIPDDETLCLGNGRYALEVRWRTEDGATGVGRPIGFDAAGTTGFFWFFDQANIELVVKMLDGAVLNDHDWLFAGALSNVEYWISAVDTLSGATRSYHNAPGNICGFADIDAFWKQGGGPIGPGFEVARAPAVAASSLSLLGGRFAVEVSWKTPDGATGSGVAVSATDQSGYFWFFDQANLELVVKMLDGLGVNGHYWLFHGALSNVEYEIAVTDQVTSERKVWRNPQGTICGGADIEAF